MVATVSAGDLSIVFNGDFNYFMGSETANFGLSLGAGYALMEQFSLSARGEFLYGDLGSGVTDESLVTGTLSARYMPTDGIGFTLEPRIDYSSVDRYPNNDGGADGVSFAITLGATGHFDG